MSEMVAFQETMVWVESRNTSEPRPTAIGLYDSKGREKGTFTLELREFSPAHVLVQISGNPKLEPLRNELEQRFGKPLRQLRDNARKLEKIAGITIIPRPNEEYAEWEVKATLGHTVFNNRYDLTEDTRRLIEACAGLPNPYFIFVRLAIAKAIADRLKALNRALAISRGHRDKLHVTSIGRREDFELGVKFPVMDGFHLIDAEDSPRLYGFPSPVSPMGLSSIAISEYQRFHYGFRRELFLLFAKKRELHLEDRNIESFAKRGPDVVLSVLNELGIVHTEHGYRFCKLPLSLLRAISRYTSLKHPEATLLDLRLVLREEFCVLVDPSDIEKIGSEFGVRPKRFLAESGHESFIRRLEYAGIIKIQPDGEAVLA